MTTIEWTDATWNPTRGCSIVSPGCINCYAMKQAHRFGGSSYAGLTVLSARSGPQWTGAVRTIPAMLDVPLRWRRPRRVFVDSMSDLFHEDVPDAFLDQVFAVMALARQHTFQVLTKRPERMRAYVGGLGRSFARLQDACPEGWSLRWSGVPLVAFPLPNVWLGVSVEDQQRADDRIPLLLDTPAAVRFISAEPLLEEVGLYAFLRGEERDRCLAILGAGRARVPGLDWVIVGGESGAGARPFDITWARRIVADCQAAGVACFVKQLGSVAQETFARLPSDPRHLPEGWMPIRRNATDGAGLWFRNLSLTNRKGGDPAEWPEDLRVRQFPSPTV